mmetsp:Transcript_62917/g.73209  ORF Transcript_62917/g.73209 Transcript_62917/m.73209 type:complete len:203 (-) Transcript_62917:259-867(-)
MSVNMIHFFSFIIMFIFIMILAVMFFVFHISEESKETFLISFLDNSSGLSSLFVLLFFLLGLLSNVFAFLPFNFSTFSLLSFSFVFHLELLDQNVVFEVVIWSEVEFKSEVVWLLSILRWEVFNSSQSLKWGFIVFFDFLLESEVSFQDLQPVILDDLWFLCNDFIFLFSFTHAQILLVVMEIFTLEFLSINNIVDFVNERE